MTTAFPAALDALTNPTSANTLNSPPHSAQHANTNDAVEALEAKVGVDASAVTTSLDYLAKAAANPGHTHPALYVPLATVTTKGDIYVATASGTVTRRAVGSNSQVLTADSAQSDGVKWATPASDAATTKGDLLVHNGTTLVRVAVGSNGQGLVADSTQSAGVKWAVVGGIWTQISSYTTVANNETVTFASIDSATYKRFRLTCLWQATSSSGGIKIEFNADTTAANYASEGVQASSTTPTAWNFAAGSLAGIPSGNSTVGVDTQSMTHYEVVKLLAGSVATVVGQTVAGNSLYNGFGGRWTNTANLITQIDVLAAAGQIKAGSTFILEGAA